MKTTRSIAINICLANLPLGLLGAYGLLLLGGMAFGQWRAGRWDEAGSMFVWILPAACLGYHLAYGYARVALRRSPPWGEGPFWRLSALYNAAGGVVGLVYGLLGWWFPGFLWFVVAAALSAWCWIHERKETP